MKKTKSFFSAAIVIVDNYILLACRKNWDENSGKKYVAGNLGGVFETSTEAEFRDDINSEKNIRRLFEFKMEKSAVGGEMVLGFIEFTKYFSGLIYENIKGIRKINAVKESLEEGGIIVTEMDEIFVHEQSNKYGPQFFYLATRIAKFDGVKGKFTPINSLKNELPKLNVDYYCLDGDIDHIRAIHIDKVFSQKDVEIIPSHVQPIMGVITHYKKIKKQ